MSPDFWNILSLARRLYAQALEEAAAQGVRLEAVDCLVTPATLTPGAPVEIRLEG